MKTDLEDHLGTFQSRLSYVVFGPIRIGDLVQNPQHSPDQVSIYPSARKESTVVQNTHNQWSRNPECIASISPFVTSAIIPYE